MCTYSSISYLDLSLFTDLHQTLSGYGLVLTQLITMAVSAMMSVYVYNTYFDLLNGAPFLFTFIGTFMISLTVAKCTGANSIGNYHLFILIVPF